MFEMKDTDNFVISAEYPAGFSNPTYCWFCQKDETFESDS